ncbi:hypothetical protein [Hydrocarboniphaga effusa]|jgi:hypothetical protein|uniref:hypothetical protein n=1 Tax=Hydrocarboniphaga effusa TaxID=243629 RepID=UPI003137977A
MTDQLHPDLRGSLWSALLSIATSSSTLICCALPALLVAIGAGATLAGLVSAVPQLIWLSTHKAVVFGGAGVMLAIAGGLQYRARLAPCPADARLAAACMRARRASLAVYVISLAIFGIGVFFAFVLPGLG